VHTDGCDWSWCAYVMIQRGWVGDVVWCITTVVTGGKSMIA
jgi:hypothetical protein